MEAALFFSLPSWERIVNPAWPGDGTYQFAAAVLVGACAALLLCHIVPATCADTLISLLESRAGRIALWPAGAWMCAGAAASLLQFARASASFYVGLRQYEPVRAWVAALLTVLGVLIAMALAWQRTVWQRAVIALCLGLGVCFAVTSLAAQWSGMGIVMTNLVNGEGGLNRPLDVAEGVLLAAAPAAIVALRIEKWAFPRSRSGVLDYSECGCPSCYRRSSCRWRRCVEPDSTGDPPCQFNGLMYSLGSVRRATQSRQERGFSPPCVWLRVWSVRSGSGT